MTGATFPTEKSRLVLLITLFLFFSKTEISRAADQTALYKKITALLSSPVLKGARTALEIRSADSGRVIYSHQADFPLKPASNLKILTSAAALYYLGNNYKFKTEVWADHPIEHQYVKGNLYLKGYGDPFLVNEQMWLFSNRVYGKGLRGWTGDLIADGSFFDDQAFGQGWGDRLEAEINALSFNFNTVGFWLAPGEKAGDPLKLWTDPPEVSFIKIVNQGITAKLSPKKKLKIIRKEEKPRDVFVITGQRSLKDKPKTIYKAVREADLYTAASWADFLKAKGISFKGKIKRGKVPEKAVLLALHRSRPLKEIIAGLNKYSNNFMAEMILKTLGAEKSGEPGTARKGIGAVKKFIRHLGGDPSRLTMVDGSGLSPRNRITVHLLCRVLLYLYNDFGLGAEFVSSLVNFAEEGTLKNRSYKLKKLVRAKSGHIKRVAALSGYLKSKQDGIYIFSMIMNGQKTSLEAINDLQDRLCLLIRNEL